MFNKLNDRLSFGIVLLFAVQILEPNQLVPAFVYLFSTVLDVDIYFNNLDQSCINYLG